MTAPAAYSVFCARCGHWWYENDPEVRPAYGDFWCTNEAECDERCAEQWMAGDHPDGF